MKAALIPNWEEPQEEMPIHQDLHFSHYKNKSWSFPAVYDHRNSNDLLKFRETDHSTTMIKTKKIQVFFFIFFILSFTLYAYLVGGLKTVTGKKLDGKQESNQPSGSPPNTEDRDCFHLFRLHNCDYRNPIGEICHQLYHCIQSAGPSNGDERQYEKRNQTKKSSAINTDQSLEKIENLEEFLENLLLIFCGVGMMRVLKSLISFPEKLKEVVNYLGSEISEFVEEIKEKITKKKI